MLSPWDLPRREEEKMTDMTLVGETQYFSFPYVTLNEKLRNQASLRVYVTAVNYTVFFYKKKLFF